MKCHGIFGIILFLTLAPLGRGQTLEVMHSFSDGPYFRGRLAHGIDGNFYGTTDFGGTNGLGTVFTITTNGIFTTLCSLSKTNRRAGWSHLMQGSNGDLYGTIFTGCIESFDGTNTTTDCGSVFELTASGEFTTLVTFDSLDYGPISSSALLQCSDGYFYGTTAPNGTNNSGTVFRMADNGSLTTLVTLTNIGGGLFAFPQGLIEGSDGNLFGTAGATVFKITDGVLTNLIKFNSTYGDAGGLMQGTDGFFYGITSNGGTNNNGIVFKMTANGAWTTLAAFSTNSAATSGLVESVDGNFYGENSGTDYGTIFKMAPDGTLTTVITFNDTNGRNPSGQLIRGKDDNLYGTTQQGGEYGRGTIFRIVMPVTLNLQVSGNELVLSWPTNALGFTLQSAADLLSPTNWMDFTNAPGVVGTQFTVTNSLSASAQFYRLKKP